MLPCRVTSTFILPCCSLRRGNDTYITEKPTQPLLLLFPSSDEPRQLLPIKVSRSLEQALEKLNLSSKTETLESSCTGRDELMDGTGVAHGTVQVQHRVFHGRLSAVSECCVFSHLQNCILEAHWDGLCSAGELAEGWGRIWGQAWQCFSWVKLCCSRRRGGCPGESWHHVQERSLQGGEYLAGSPLCPACALWPGS